MLRKTSVLSVLSGTLAFVVAALLPAAPVEAAEAFTRLKGSWSGGGKATFAGGQSEKLRCSARYSGGSENLTMTLRCASSSAQINLSSQLGANGSKVSGSWSESSFGASGGLNGSATGSGLRMRISGGLSGSLSISIAGNRQTVAMSSEGTLTGVSLSMSRR